MGETMNKRLRQFAKKGKAFAESLPPDFVSKLTDSIISYRDLIMPPKIFGGYCPCLKPARSGIEYEKKLMIVKAKMASTIFLCQAVIIESHGEQHNMQSMHFADYVNKMNSIFNSLSEIKCTGGERGLETARKKLQPCIVSIEKFIANYEEDFAEGSFKAEAKRRLRSTQELLVSRQQADGDAPSTGLPISKRVLVKAQSTLQEIMNSAASISSNKAKEHLLQLDKLATDLKKARDQEVNIFNHLEDGMHENNLMDMLHRLREDSEVVHSDANSKVRDAIKRWSSVKTQSVQRKVVEYEEEFDHPIIKNPQLSLGPPPILDPAKLVKGAAFKINGVGQDFVTSVVSVANSGAAGVKNIASVSANSAVKAGNIVASNVLSLGSDSEPPHHAAAAPSPKVRGPRQSNGKAATSKTTKSGFDPLDSIKSGFDSITGNNQPPPPPPAPPKKSSSGLFNPLDSFMDGIDSVTGNGSHQQKKPSTMSMFNPLEGF